MSLTSVGRSSLCLSSARRQSYIEISNYFRKRAKTSSPTRQYFFRYETRLKFHTTPKLRQQTPKLRGHIDLQKYKDSVEFPAATHSFQSLLQNAEIGDTVVLHGYLGNRSDLSKNLSFARLKDPMLRQCIQMLAFGNGANNILRKLKAITSNSPIAIRGTIQPKKGALKDRESPDEERIDSIEIKLDDIWPLNMFPTDIIMTPDTVFPPEQRYLQLRSDHQLRDAIRFRANVRNICKEELERQCNPPFVEIETPLLFKSTPEGAREFLVPTRRKGLAYALPQSPQQYKQILMASGIPRYFQFARCFRDEDLRADRQPEFTQLDLEMSFSTGSQVMAVIEGLTRRLWSTLLDISIPPQPFAKMTYHDAMVRYGSDKPDTRYGMEITRLDYLLPVDLVRKISDLTDPIVEAFKLESQDNDPNKTKNFISDFLDSPSGAEFNKNPDGGPGVFVYDTKKPLCGLQAFGFEAAERVEEILQPDHGDLVILQARKNEPFSGGSTQLGELRRAIHSAAVTIGFSPVPKGYDFRWIVDFPLFTPTSADAAEPGQGGNAGIASTHHPFTAPKTAADVELLITNPTAAIADHYDLVVNGIELGGGSRRIHNHELQEFVLRDILQVSPKRLLDFSHLLDALRAGCPPHAGIALGFDRLVAVMLGKESVRDVIAFPKTGRGGDDAMVKAPSPMTQEALQTYHLTLISE